MGNGMEGVGVYVSCRSGTLELLSTCMSPPEPRQRELLLDSAERRLRNVDMEPLLTGEFVLLVYLGGRSGVWHQSHDLSVSIFGRADRGGRQLVWKYASTLRKKLASEMPELLMHCRRRGYCCVAPVVLLPSRYGEHAAPTP